jgi:hypothetical protein
VLNIATDSSAAAENPVIGLSTARGEIDFGWVSVDEIGDCGASLVDKLVSKKAI